MENIKAISFFKNINPVFTSSANKDKVSPSAERQQIKDIPFVPQPCFGALKITTAKVCDEIYAPLVQTEHGKKGLELLKGLDNKFARKIYSSRAIDKRMFAIFLDSLDEKKLVTLGENIKTLNSLAGDYEYIIERIYPFAMPKLLEREPEKLEKSADTLKALGQDDLNFATRGGINDFLAGTRYSEDCDEFLKSYENFRLTCQEMCITPEQGIGMLIEQMGTDDNQD